MKKFRENLYAFLIYYDKLISRIYYIVLLSSLFFIGTYINIIAINFCWLVCLFEAWARYKGWKIYLVVLIAIICNLVAFL